MRTVLRSYEPVFGGIVAAQAFALLVWALYISSRHTFDSATSHIIMYSLAAIAWGVLQVFGYRDAKRRGIAVGEPVLGTATGCVLLGLLLAIVTVFLYLFAQNMRYAIAIGSLTVSLLCAGAVVGIRQGVWNET